MVLIAYPFIQNFIIGHEETIFFSEKKNKKKTINDFEPVHGEVYSIQHYVINIVSYLRHVGGILRFPSSIKTDHHDITEIFLKVAFNTINHQSPIIFNKHRKRTNDAMNGFEITPLVVMGPD
jgi:hypothetical protein